MPLKIPKTLPAYSVLSNENIFFIDMYKAGLGQKIEEYFREMIAGKGSCKATIYRHIQ